MARTPSFFSQLLSSVWFITLEVFLLFSLLFSLVKQINKGYHLRQGQAILKQHLTEEQTRQESLQKLLVLLKSPTVQEKNVREHLGLQRPGEKVVVVEEGGGALPLPATAADHTLNASWRSWKEYFWGKE